MAVVSTIFFTYTLFGKSALGFQVLHDWERVEPVHMNGTPKTLTDSLSYTDTEVFTPHLTSPFHFINVY